MKVTTGVLPPIPRSAIGLAVTLVVPCAAIAQGMNPDDGHRVGAPQFGQRRSLYVGVGKPL